MQIKINHIAKMEGHAGFMASVVRGDVKSAKIEVQEGIRLIEGVLIGRYYTDMPIVAQRICGICPVVHNLTSIKALENAMGVRVTPETEKLRTIMELGQIIHSHALHLFFLSLADFLDMDNDIQLISEYPEETKMAVRLREFGMGIVKVIGGRVIHPMNNEVGGFKKSPEKEALQKIMEDSENVLQDALKLGKFFQTIKIPDFQRKTEYIGLSQGKKYAIYDGDIISSEGMYIAVNKFENNFHELQKQKEVIKKVEHNGNSYMTGAIARINLNREFLSTKAKEYLDSLNFIFPDYNPFHNILAQMVELIHCIETVRAEIEIVLKSDLEKAVTTHYDVVAGEGMAAVEAPRGTLYYHVSVDEKGYIQNVNIITPTAQVLANLEDDIAEYIKEILDPDDASRQRKLRAFIRAYDPCISCAVH